MRARCAHVGERPSGAPIRLRAEARNGVWALAHVRNLILVFCGLIASATAGESIPLIYDTDIGNDVDDVLAMGVIHSLQTRGQCELLAVTITKDHDQCAPFVDAINTFYGRGEIPIGVCRSGVTPEQSKFTGLAEEKSGREDRYPHDLRSGKDAPDAVSVLRRALADQRDRSVVIAQVGFSTNLAGLLKSPADDISEWTGMELVTKKVRLLSVMAGAFAPIRGKEHIEYNVVKDIPSAQALASDWPTPIVYSGFEIGLAADYPATSIDRDYEYVPHHPLKEAYYLYNPPPHNRPTWDLTSVLYGVFPDAGYFDLSPTGTVTVDDKGRTHFKADPDGRRRYLIMSDLQRERVVEALVQLSSQPPETLRGLRSAGTSQP
ncbi:MAG: nucleoside hydrolase [Planctomycetaceae bacterium]|nr:nucleoside hydrolase [Planctomycetaceae bacterium]